MRTVVPIRRSEIFSDEQEARNAFIRAAEDWIDNVLNGNEADYCDPTHALHATAPTADNQSP